MSTGLLPFLCISESFEKPVRPPRDPETVLQWETQYRLLNFGAPNLELMDGLGDALFVEVEIGHGGKWDGADASG
jgi:hypothetical protein